MKSFRTILALLLCGCIRAFSLDQDSETGPVPNEEEGWQPIDIFRLIDEDSTKLEWLPVVNYDSDFGFGGGVKMFYLSPFGGIESFDILLFASTGGERLYAFTFSIPDFEMRQGTKYGFSFDIIAEYDMMKKIGFYEPGMNGSKEPLLWYTKEPFDVRMVFGHGFSPVSVGNAGFRYRYTGNYTDNNNGYSNIILKNFSNDKIHNISTFFNLRYDTRDSYINPQNGINLFGEFEFAIENMYMPGSFSTITLESSGFTEIPFFNSVLAGRIKYETTTGKNIPFSFLPVIGGNRTLRGYPQDRFRGSTALLMNGEWRIPLVWDFGIVIGYDAGRVFLDGQGLTLNDLAGNSVMGLRYYFKTFIVRLDLGFSSEQTGVYFNFGQIF